MILSANEKSFSNLVLESSHPVIVHFCAPWCGLCRLIQPTLLSFQGEWPEEVRLVSINADENFKLANTFRLRNLPTIIIFDRSIPIHRFEGIQSREELKQILELTMGYPLLRSA